MKPVMVQRLYYVAFFGHLSGQWEGFNINKIISGKGKLTNKQRLKTINYPNDSKR
jgi:hypothetical protein